MFVGWLVTLTALIGGTLLILDLVSRLSATALGLVLLGATFYRSAAQPEPPGRRKPRRRDGTNHAGDRVA